jgi:hypothetical protein
MGTNRIAFAAPAAGVCAGLLLGLFEVQGWEMPDWLAVPLLLVLVSGTIVFVAIAGYEVSRGIAWLRSKLEWRWPISIKQHGIPDPNQWLLDLAQQQVESPGAYWVRTAQYLESWDVGAVRPYVRLRFEYFNGGIHVLKVTGATGYPTVFGERCADQVFDANRSWHSVPPAHPSLVTLTVYFPKEMADRMHQAISQGALNGVIGLLDVTFGLAVEADGGREVRVPITGDDRYPKRN